MRTLIKFQLPVDAGNRAIVDGTLAKKLPALLADLRPEAAYFLTENGLRTGYIVCDIEKPSHIPFVAEPFFQLFGATVTIAPIMTGAELAEGLERAAKAPR